jgi:hypothetical protein
VGGGLDAATAAVSTDVAKPDTQVAH